LWRYSNFLVGFQDLLLKQQKLPIYWWFIAPRKIAKLEMVDPIDIPTLFGLPSGNQKWQSKIHHLHIPSKKKKNSICRECPVATFDDTGGYRPWVFYDPILIHITPPKKNISNYRSTSISSWSTGMWTKSLGSGGKSVASPFSPWHRRSAQGLNVSGVPKCGSSPKWMVYNGKSNSNGLVQWSLGPIPYQKKSSIGITALVEGLEMPGKWEINCESTSFQSSDKCESTCFR